MINSWITVCQLLLLRQSKRPCGDYGKMEGHVKWFFWHEVFVKDAIKGSSVKLADLSMC